MLLTVLHLWHNYGFSLCKFRIFYAYIVIACIFVVVYLLVQQKFNEYIVLAIVLDRRDSSVKDSIKIFDFKEVNILVRQYNNILTYSTS